MRLRSVLLSLCFSLLGCGSGGGDASPPSEPGAQPAVPPTPAPQAAKPDEPAKPTVEDTSFRLALESDKQYAAGQPATARLLLEARGGYHVNQDYPIRVDLKAPAGVTLAKASLGKSDAASFGEQSARFDLGFTAPKGAHQLAATVDFAVCTAETCVPDQRTVAVALDVQ